jgi:nucleoside-diphosphate-sugar epimerase
MAERSPVAGGGGFSAHQMVKNLVAQCYGARGAAIRRLEFQPAPAHEMEVVDLRRGEAYFAVARNITQSYDQAPDPVIAHVTADKARRNNVVMNVHVLDVATCRNIAFADNGGANRYLGRRKYTRSCISVDDCVEGLHRLMHSDRPIPRNVDTGQVVSLDELVKVAPEVTDKRVEVRSLPDGSRLRQRQRPVAPRLGIGTTDLAAEGDGAHLCLDRPALSGRPTAINHRSVARLPRRGRLREPDVTAG